ncbi:MAG: hypothetical protein IKO36_00860 [Bacteroidaceae bacterium]|nr:hypothetical protein [Bacteroidaceae bacterium]
MDKNLQMAYWFAENGYVDTAIACVEDAFDNFIQFRAWYLTECNPEYRLFNEHFIKWVAKIMILFYDGHCDKNDIPLVNATKNEII